VIIAIKLSFGLALLV